MRTFQPLLRVKNEKRNAELARTTNFTFSLFGAYAFIGHLSPTFTKYAIPLSREMNTVDTQGMNQPSTEVKDSNTNAFFTEHNAAIGAFNSTFLFTTCNTPNSKQPLPGESASTIFSKPAQVLAAAHTSVQP